MKKRLFFVLTLFAVCSLAFGQKKFSKITAADFATPSDVESDGGEQCTQLIIVQIMETQGGGKLGTR